MVEEQKSQHRLKYRGFLRGKSHAPPQYDGMNIGNFIRELVTLFHLKDQFLMI